jgi:hypothetical protein
MNARRHNNKRFSVRPVAGSMKAAAMVSDREKQATAKRTATVSAQAIVWKRRREVAAQRQHFDKSVIAITFARRTTG